MASIPGWMNDPADFIRVVHQLSGGTNKEVLKAEIAALRADIDRLRPKPEPSYVAGVQIVPAEAPVEVIPPEEVMVLPESAIAVKPQPVIPARPEPQLDYEQAQLLTQLAALSNLTQIKEKLTKEEFEGKLDPRTLSATDSLKWLDLIEGLPHKPWITAYFINDGPNSVKIRINHPELEFQVIKLNETLTINQEHADERIRRLFYKCDTGETASVRVVGQY